MLSYCDIGEIDLSYFICNLSEIDLEKREWWQGRGHSKRGESGDGRRGGDRDRGTDNMGDDIDE